ncbi:Spy/CpxP family protein refolding chaperone [Pseudescherichia vulneris]
MKSVFKLAVLTTALAFSGMVNASPAAEPLPQETLVQPLKLTPEQMQKVSALREKAQKELNAISTSDVKQDAIVDMFRSGEWNDRAAKKQLEAISGIQTQIRFQRVKYLFDVSQVLTAEQKQQLQKMMLENQMY